MVRVIEKQINNEVEIELCPCGERSNGIKLRWNWEVERKCAKVDELVLVLSQDRLSISD